MVYRPDIDDSLCFVLLPLRAPYLGYFDQIITPAAKEAGLTAIKASDIYGTRPVIADIWDHIWRAKVVVAIVSGRNPNVNYELGICHTLGIPTVLLSDNKTDVPFDYQHRRYIPYETANAGWEQHLRENLIKTLQVAKLPSNPADELQWPYDTEKLVTKAIVEELTTSTESRDAFLSGIRLVRSAEATALGPDGTSIAFKTNFGGTTLALDGVRIANSINSGHPIQLQGIEAMRQIASETHTRVGDYAKTAVLIGAALIAHGEDAIRKGHLLNGVVEGMERAVEVATAHLLTEARAITDEDIQQVALTASRDTQLSALATEALRRVGADGIVTIDDSSEDQSTLDLQEGLHFNTGFLSNAFVTDAERQECVLDDPYILLFEGRITAMKDLLPLLEYVVRSGRSLLIIANDVADEALATLIVNCQKGTLRAAAVRASGFGDRMRHAMEDVAVATGGRAFLIEYGVPLANVTTKSLGSAKRAIITSSSTTIVGGAAKETELETHVARLRNQINQTKSAFDQEKLRERLARIASGIATIRIGGRSDDARTKAKYATMSALHSIQTAKDNGVVAGGGTALIRAAQKVSTLGLRNAAQEAGAKAVSEALLEPALSILRNAKKNEQTEIADLLRSTDPSTGYNADTGTIADMLQAGVKDSARGLKEALLVSMAHVRQALGIGAWAMEVHRPNDEQRTTSGQRTIPGDF
ncbi:MAG TPA: chaperonin GroEL [Acidobacteriaceae bacterium]|nr:chaperonin GroEL [Acidobacteriaceae bacterium]